MDIAAETVQVQLVNSWWEQIIPVAALLISLFAVGLTLFFRYADRLRLKVNTSWSTMIGHDGDILEGEDRVTVEVTNKSPNITTQITALTLQLAGGNNFAYMDPGPWDDQLPKTIGPGESMSLSYPARGLGIALQGQANGAGWVRGRAVSGHKTVVAKKRRDLVRELRSYALRHPHRPR
ncbi:hypothetical protein ACU18_14205 [Arthrobacter sp. ZBG10]|uniref:hypothetical protein n=1 Tax=Arthrobacter sp. ZBG10 TaxID=1676590 RepID=UPI00068061F5|nr:hypothetical protein [Arthrobacter sp. ZBG10]KNH16304.1 hypothetical protein ACU18_14205 [Arthrobacter sp. ZBG10]